MDPSDERAAYREALARAEEAALAGETPQMLVTTAELETPAATEPDPAAPEATEVPAGEETPPVEPATPADTSTAEPEVLLAGKYRTVEELEKAYAEASAHIGRQGLELGERVQQLEEQLALAQQQQQQAQQQPPRVHISDEMIYEDPAAATLLAYQQGDEVSIAKAFNAWREEDPFTSGQWLTDRKLEAQQAAFQQAQEAQRAQVEEIARPQQEAQQKAADQAAWSEAFKIVGAEDANEIVRVLEEVAPQFPAIAQSIATGDAKVKAEGLALLMAFDARQKQDPAAVAADAAAEARAAAESAAAARAEAAVVTQDTAGLGAAPEELSPEEAEAKRYVDRFAGRPSLSKGWTGRG